MPISMKIYDSPFYKINLRFGLFSCPGYVTLPNHSGICFFIFPFFILSSYHKMQLSLSVSCDKLCLFLSCLKKNRLLILAVWGIFNTLLLNRMSEAWQNLCVVLSYLFRFTIICTCLIFDQIHNCICLFIISQN